MRNSMLLGGIAAVIAVSCWPQPLKAEGPASAPPVRTGIAIGETAITISGATAGSTYYVIGLGRKLDGPEVIRRYFRLESSTDTDGDGVLTLEIEGGIPEESLWAAVNRQGGAILSAVPRTFPRALPRFLEDEYLTEGPLGPLLLSGEQLVVLFRPGVGAWVWRGRADVVPSRDPDLPDRLLLPPWTFDPLGADDPLLKDYLPGDLLFSLDQRTFDLRRLVLEAGEVAR
jgi:hypothetical protein